MTVDLAALGARLRDARQNLGLSQEAVAEKVGLPRTAVVHIEAGSRSISTVELSEFARLYHRRIADFFQEGSKEDQDILVAIHRLAPEFKDLSKLKREIARHVRICQTGVELRSLLGLPTHSAPPRYDLTAPSCFAEAVRQGNSVAEAERRRLNLGDHPIPDLADLITAEGIWCSGSDFPDGMSGMFLQHSSIGLVVLVNYADPRARKRFSYAHEYAHALMDRDHSVTVSRSANRQSLIEVRANAFAASFLMPAHGITTFLAQRNKGLGSRENVPVYDVDTEQKGLEVEAMWRSSPGSQRITCQLVARLAHHYGASYQSTTYRLKGLGIIADSETKQLLAQEGLGLTFLEAVRMKDELMGQDDRRVRKPDRELVGEVLSLAVEARDREEISGAKLLEIGSLLGISRDQLLKFA